MKNWFLYPFSVLFVFIITISILIGEDKAWVDCSNEDDLYRYINEDWKVDKVINQSFNAEKYGDIIEKYEIENEKYVITQEVTYQELWRVDPKTNSRTSIKRVFSFGKFAKECAMIKEQPIFFASVKEYFFGGGWAEPNRLTIFDLKGNKIGIAPSWEYVDELCKFY